MIDNKLACVFPGQGSQSVGMLGELATAYPVVEATFAEASEVLGYDLWQLTQQGPETELNQTAKTQPALLAASVAIWRIWQAQQSRMPALLAGHSLGEYSALVCADSMAFTDAIKLVALRGEYMQAACPEGKGAMAAIIGLDDAVVIAVCATVSEGEIVTAANFNAIGQVVIAGETAAVERAIIAAKDAGAKIAKRIPVSVPSHCELMRPAAQRLSEALADVAITAPSIPVIHNVNVSEVTHGDDIRQALVEQLYSPVRWVETIQLFAEQGILQLVECGPGKVLAGLNKRIVKTMTVQPLTAPEAFTA